jgi:hypothetical protein
VANFAHGQGGAISLLCMSVEKFGHMSEPMFKAAIKMGEKTW